MRVLCLFAPRLAVDLALSARRQLAGRAVVLIAGHGGEAIVTARSPEANAAGVVTGMAARLARGHCPSAIFLPDNEDACRREMERLACVLAVRAAAPIRVGGRDHLLVTLDAEPGREQLAAKRVMQLAEEWSGWSFRAGVASNEDEALEMARVARRGLAVLREAAPATSALAGAPPSTAGSIRRVPAAAQRLRRHAEPARVASPGLLL